MADTPVTPTPVGSWPTAPQRTDEPATFVTRADAWVAATPTRTTEMNALATNVNFNAESAFDSATEAATSASNASASEDAALASSVVALGAANFVGLYSSLTGAKTAGITAEYQGAIWLLITNSSDITADVPGVSAKWARAYGGGIIYPRTTNIEFTAEDNGKIFEYTSGTFTQTFDEAANLKEGWSITLVNTAANITFDPSGSETIDRSTMGPGQVFLVVCDGASDFAIIPMAQDRQSLGITEPFENSGTFTAKKSGWHRVTAVGAGASGGVAWNSSATAVLSATGGGAGGFAVKEFYALAGTAYTLTIGTGGAAVSRTTNGATSGNNGGNTTVSGFGVSITCTGGTGGTASVTATTLTGATGGAATGGDVNVTGGASGGVANTSSSGGRGASGGGAVGVRGTGYASGAVAVSGGSAANAASGGAGIGGASGTATSTGGQNSASGGGGALGASSAAANTATAGGVGAASLTVQQLNGTGSTGSTSASVASPAGNGGAGSGALVGTTDNSTAAGQLFAGAGGRATQVSAGSSASAGGRGAGGGGMAAYTSSGSPDALASGAGGSCLVIVEY